MEYRVQLGDSVLRVHARRNAGYGTGDTVILSIPPERCVVIPDNPSKAAEAPL